MVEMLLQKSNVVILLVFVSEAQAARFETLLDRVETMVDVTPGDIATLADLFGIEGRFIRTETSEEAERIAARSPPRRRRAR